MFSKFKRIITNLIYFLKKEYGKKVELFFAKSLKIFFLLFAGWAMIKYFISSDWIKAFLKDFYLPHKPYKDIWEYLFAGIRKKIFYSLIDYTDVVEAWEIQKATTEALTKWHDSLENPELTKESSLQLKIDEITNYINAVFATYEIGNNLMFCLLLFIIFTFCAYTPQQWKSRNVSLIEFCKYMYLNCYCFVISYVIFCIWLPSKNYPQKNELSNQKHRIGEILHNHLEMIKVPGLKFEIKKILNDSRNKQKVKREVRKVRDFENALDEYYLAFKDRKNNFNFNNEILNNETYVNFRLMLGGLTADDVDPTKPFNQKIVPEWEIFDIQAKSTYKILIEDPISAILRELFGKKVQYDDEKLELLMVRNKWYLTHNIQLTGGYDKLITEAVIKRDMLHDWYWKLENNEKVVQKNLWDLNSFIEFRNFYNFAKQEQKQKEKEFEILWELFFFYKDKLNLNWEDFPNNFYKIENGAVSFLVKIFKKTQNEVIFNFLKSSYFKNKKSLDFVEKLKATVEIPFSNDKTETEVIKNCKIIIKSILDSSLAKEIRSEPEPLIKDYSDLNEIFLKMIKNINCQEKNYFFEKEKMFNEIKKKTRGELLNSMDIFVNGKCNELISGDVVDRYALLGYTEKLERVREAEILENIYKIKHKLPNIASNGDTKNWDILIYEKFFSILKKFNFEYLFAEDVRNPLYYEFFQNLGKTISAGEMSFGILFTPATIGIHLYAFILLILALPLIPKFISFKVFAVEKLSSYECGFAPFSLKSVANEAHYVIVGIIFLIFDLEIVYFVPFLVNVVITNMSRFLFLFFNMSVVLTVVIELSSGAISWPVWMHLKRNKNELRDLTWKNKIKSLF